MDILSRSDVPDRHLTPFRDYDVEARLAHCASDGAPLLPTVLLTGSAATERFFEALVSECEVGQAAFHAELVQMWSIQKSATAAPRTKVDVGCPEVVPTSTIEHRQGETGLHRLLPLTRRTWL